MKKLIFFILFLMFFSTGVHAAQNGFEVMSFRPVTDNGNYLSVWDSHILNRGEWFFGTTFDYSYRPLQTTTNGIRDAGVLDKIFEQHIYSSVGIIKDRLQVGIDLPIGWWLKYRDQNKVAFGDFLLNAKVSFLNMQKSGVGLAVVPFISIPTGKSDYFFGSGVMSAGANMVAELNPFKRVFVAMNLGLLAKKSYLFRDIDDTSKLTGGLGLAFIATDNLKISGDLVFKTRLSGVFKEKEETPVELLTGVKYAIANTGFVVSGALGAGIINGAGAPAYRILFGLGFDLSSCKGNSVNTAEDATATNKQPMELVHFDFNSITINNSTEKSNLEALTKILRSDKTKKVLVEGNADSIGSKVVNDKISKQRADVVTRYISNLGIDKKRITVKSYGSENPVADNNIEEGRRANRRVEVKMLEQTK